MGDTSYNQVNALLCNRCVHTCVLACLCAGMCEPLYQCTPVTHMHTHTHTHTDAHPRTHTLHTPTCTHPHTQPHTLTDTHPLNHTRAHTHRQCETPVEPTCYCIPGSLHSSHSHMLISSPPRCSAMHTHSTSATHAHVYSIYIPIQ